MLQYQNSQDLGYVPRAMQIFKCQLHGFGALYEPLSKLLVSPLISAIVVPYIIPYITPFKEFRLWLIWDLSLCKDRIGCKRAMHLPLSLETCHAWGGGGTGELVRVELKISSNSYNRNNNNSTRYNRNNIKKNNSTVIINVVVILIETRLVVV